MARSLLLGYAFTSNFLWLCLFNLDKTIINLYLKYQLTWLLKILVIAEQIMFLPKVRRSVEA